MDLLQKNKAKISDLISQTFELIQARYSMSEQLFTVASVWGQIIFVLDKSKDNSFEVLKNLSAQEEKIKVELDKLFEKIENL